MQDVAWKFMPDLLALCRQAGEAILAVYGDARSIKIDEKPDQSPVTQADLAAHQVLMNGLRLLTPHWPILSEEGIIPGYEQRRRWTTYWLVDPLDGTREFIDRNGEFTVNIALIHQCKAILGVIYVPVTGWHYWGAIGYGAFKQDAAGKINTMQVRTISQRLAQQLPLEIVASRRLESTPQQQLILNLTAIFGPPLTKVVGSSLKFCLLADGLADFYPRLGLTSEWDTAAAQGILEAAGGQVVDLDFAPLRYNQKESLLNPYFYALADTDVDWRNILVATT